MNKEKRGKMLMRGVLETTKDRVSTQVGAIVLGTLALIVFWLFILNNIESRPIYDKILIWIVLILITIVYFVFGLLITGFEIDAIYELGITNRHTALHDKLLGRTFQRFESIAMIKYGKTEWFNLGKVDFIVLIDRDKGQILRPFLALNYKNNFFRALLRQIREKNPDAKWIPVKYQDIGRR